MLNSPGKRNSIVQGVMLTVAMRWCNRLISVISTLILARLLQPDDFGVVALAFMVLAFIQVFLEFGVGIALVQNARATEEHFHSAWTLRLIQALAVAAMLALGAPLGAAYFNDPRLTAVLQVLALNVLIGSFENIGIVSFQKNMQFGMELRYLVINRLVTFVFVVFGAWLLRSYWAMIVAGTLGGIFTIAHSYVVHPMRPRWSTRRLGELFAVSQWLLLRNIGIYADTNLHKMLVGRRTDTATMGGYALASDVAGMPSSELLQPLNRVLFPAFVQAKADLVELKRLFLLAQSLQVLVAVPAGVFVSLVAGELVPVLLGARWVLCIPFLQVLALASVIEAIMTSPSYVVMTLGRFKQITAVVWCQVAVFVALALWWIPERDATRIAIARVIAVLVGMGIYLVLVRRALPGLRFGELVAGTWRPLAAVATTAAVVLQAEAQFPAHPLPALVLKLAACIVVYTGTVYVLWRLQGRPRGAEVYIAEKLAHFSQRRLTPAAPP
jgi:O-antigen/teichoic acid export membrane protein